MVSTETVKIYTVLELEVMKGYGQSKDRKKTAQKLE